MAPKQMNVAINCRSFLNRRYTGIGRYTYHLVRSLSEIDDRSYYELYVKKGFFNFSKKTPRIPAKNFHLKMDRFNLGLDRVLKNIDIYHSPSPDTLDINHGTKIVVSVHDLIFKTFPQGHTQKTIDSTERQFRNIIDRASKIICVSKNTLKDMHTYFKIDKNKTALVYQGVDKNLFYIIGQEEERIADRVLKAHGVDCPFILSVGTIEPRKNLENLLYAFNILKTKHRYKGKLAIIGMKGWMSEGIAALVKKLELKSDVVFLGYVSDNELRCFYNKAEIFAFPSFYEGFGFPIVEAFCCGTPVVTSNVSSCPEIAQDAAITVDPYHPEDITEGINQLLEDRELRRTLREKGLRRSGDFTFHKTAQKTLQVYKDVYRKG